MAKLLLIRHAQASLRNKDYDQLSDLGHMQSRFLGGYLAKRNLSPTQLGSGSLRRHIETMEGIDHDLKSKLELKVDSRWNEFDFKVLLRTYIEEHCEPSIEFNTSTDPKIFFSLLKKAMFSWSAGELKSNKLETWDNFKLRISEGLEKIANQSKQSDIVLLTSSGGAISMAMKHVLGLSDEKMIDINFQIKNTSITSFEIKKDRYVLSGFNETPHLETREIKDLVTYA